MVNILLFSDNEDFKNDLNLQIDRFIDGAKIGDEKPDIIIVDEDKDIYSRKRKEYPSTPILFLASEMQINEDRLNLFVHKPFSLMRLLDIIKAANNKLDSSSDGFLVFNDYELRPSRKEIVCLQNGEVTKLTEKEVNIIKYLYKMRDEFVSKTDLQVNVWQYSENVTTHTVETHIYRLRQKVEKGGSKRLIITNNGKYKLNTD